MAKVKCSRCSFVNPEGQEHCVQCQALLPKVKIQPEPRPPQPAPSPGNGIQLIRGQLVARRYSVMNMIGRGGMGCIFKVYDNVLGEEVALKTLLPQYVRDKVVVERFFNEARIARKLAHPNIVRVHDIGSAENFVYISMEFIQGQSLRAILEKLPQGQRLPVLETLRILDQLCAALEYAHQFTIHRDIKPENVMLEQESGTVKLMDFGISKLMANNQLTGASMVMGTPFYMSPEQLRNSRDVDARADLFSVGVMFYEILTGNMPTGVPRPASQLEQGVPPVLDEIVARCVDPNPDRRFNSAAELRAALRTVRDQVTGEGPARRPAARFEAQREWPLQKVTGAALILVLLAGVALGLYGMERRRHRLLDEGVAVAAAAADTGETGQNAERLEDLLQYLDFLSSRVQPEGERMQEVFAQGKELLAAAHTLAEQDAQGARQRANEALQFLIAPHLAQEGMVFVPPGSARDGSGAYIPAFFIDAREVTVGEYFQFVSAVEEGWRVLPEHTELRAYPQFPMIRVANFDAVAFAAWRGKLLPSEAQWERAAINNEGDAYPWGGTWKEGAANVFTQTAAAPGEFEEDHSWTECYDMAGNFAEWTRTPLAGGTAEVSDASPPLGQEYIYKGGDYLSQPQPLSQRRHMPYEKWADHVGFRCIVEVPKTLTEATAVFAP